MRILLLAVAVFLINTPIDPIYDDLYTLKEADRFREIQTAILIGSSVTQEAIAQSNQSLRQVYLRLAMSIAAKQAVMRSLGISQQKAKRLQSEVEQLRRDQTALIDELAVSNITYKETIRAFREALTGLINSRDPAIVINLERYAAGDVSALDSIQQVTRIQRNARQAATRIKSGKEQIAIAQLYADAANLGKRPIAQAIAAWKEATEVDPSSFEAWQRLSQALFEMVDYRGAEEASRKSLSLSNSIEERSASSLVLGAVLHVEGINVEAKAHISEAVKLARRSLIEKPSDPIAARDVAASLNHLGDIEVTLGDYKYAERSYMESVSIRKKLDAVYPLSRGSQRDYAVSLSRFALFAAFYKHDLVAALSYGTEALTKFRYLSRMDPQNVEALSDLVLELRYNSIIARMVGLSVRARILGAECRQIASNLNATYGTGVSLSERIAECAS